MKTSSLNFLDRHALFHGVDGGRYDVLVIGGGITGAGIARDAALRGLRVALVEARDFASGTSGRSSKMIHGGLRYLAQGHVALVREAARERTILRAIAPHLVQPMPFVLPAKNAMAKAKLKTGLWTFEKLAEIAPADRHQVWSIEDIHNHEPLMRTEHVCGALTYTEYLTDDARLTLANIRSAQEAGATILSYAPVKSIILEGGKAVGVKVAGALPGETYTASIHAKFIVNAAGPWVDAIRALEDEKAEKRLLLTKGIHLVLPREKLPISHTVIMQTEDKRSVFAVPKGDFVYVGTTDTFYQQSDYWPQITRADVDYLFAALANRFAIKDLTPADIVSLWAGIRPLLAEEGKSPSEISRKDEVWTSASGILSIAGGKLTAYRKMAERVVSTIEGKLGREPSPCVTAIARLPGGDVDMNALRNAPELQKLETAVANLLVNKYGSEAINIAKDGGDVCAEMHQALHVEGALTLEDYWMRRSSRALFSRDAGLSILAEAAAIMADYYQWSPARRDQEIKTCKTIHHQNMTAIGEG